MDNFFCITNWWPWYEWDPWGVQGDDCAFFLETNIYTKSGPRKCSTIQSVVVVSNPCSQSSLPMINRVFIPLMKSIDRLVCYYMDSYSYHGWRLVIVWLWVFFFSNDKIEIDLNPYHMWMNDHWYIFLPEWFCNSLLFELLILSGMLMDHNWTEILTKREFCRCISNCQN